LAALTATNIIIALIDNRVQDDLVETQNVLAQAAFRVGQPGFGFCIAHAGAAS
jgi:hypothetical protein